MRYQKYDLNRMANDEWQQMYADELSLNFYFQTPK
jgi:hypothetical protein